MNLDFETGDSGDGGLRGRGRPRTVIPDDVRKAADATYGTGKVGRVDVGPDDAAEAQKFVQYLRLHAKHRGLGISITEDPETIRFRLRDKGRRRGKRGG